MMFGLILDGFDYGLPNITARKQSPWRVPMCRARGWIGTPGSVSADGNGLGKAYGAWSTSVDINRVRDD